MKKCHYVLQFHFKVANKASPLIKADDFLSGLDDNVTDAIQFKIRKDIQTAPVEVKTSLSDIADENQFFFIQAGSDFEIKEQRLESEEISRKTSGEWVANEELTSVRTSIKKLPKIDGNRTSKSERTRMPECEWCKTSI